MASSSYSPASYPDYAKILKNHTHFVASEGAASRRRLHLAQLPKDTPIAFICNVGVSSRAAAERFAAHGFTQLFNVEGGMDAWVREVGA